MNHERNTTHPHHSIKVWRKTDILKNTFCKCFYFLQKPSFFDHLKAALREFLVEPDD